jgi:hypothetical protein
MSWASSAAFILDGAEINLPSGKKIIGIICIPCEAAHETYKITGPDKLFASR